MAHIEWSRRSKRNITEIYRYIERASPQYADRFIDKLLARIYKLENFPESGEVFQQIPGLNLRQIVFGNYRIFFRSNQSTVLIVSIFHAARLLSEENFLPD